MVFLCSVEFGFSPICFFSYLFLFRVYFLVTNDITILPASSLLLLALLFRTCFYFVFFWFVSFFLTVIYNWEALSIFSDRQQISLKKPIMQLNKVHRQNRNKMGEDRRRKLTANHQHFNNWIKHLVGLEWKVVYLNSFSLLKSFEFIVN